MQYRHGHGDVLPSGNGCSYEFNTTDNGFPTGGESKITTAGNDSIIFWQDGVLEDGKPNGAMIEDVLEAALTRLRSFNDGPGRCRENSLAMTKIEEALLWLNARTTRRKRQETEGTYEERQPE